MATRKQVAGSKTIAQAAGETKRTKASPSKPKARGKAKKSTKSKESSILGLEALEGHIPEPTVACTDEQYREIIEILWNGTGIIRANKTVATALQCQANCGLRIGDILRLRMCDFIPDGTRYQIYMREQKTKKLRIFTIPDQCYRMLDRYAKANDIGPTERLFNMSVRNVQSRLATVCDYLGYKYIGTHSFRKYAATRLYKLSGNDVEMVRRFLQHSSASVTYHYISQTPPFMERCLKKMGNVIATF